MARALPLIVLLYATQAAAPEPAAKAPRGEAKAARGEAKAPEGEGAESPSGAGGAYAVWWVFLCSAGFGASGGFVAAINSGNINKIHVPFSRDEDREANLGFLGDLLVGMAASLGVNFFAVALTNTDKLPENFNSI